MKNDLIVAEMKKSINPNDPEDVHFCGIGCTGFAAL